MKGVLLRSVLVAALSDGGKELMGFIDDFIQWHVWEVQSSEYGWDVRWLIQSQPFCKCQCRVAGQVVILSVWDSGAIHSLPLYIRDMVGIHYIYAFGGEGTFLIFLNHKYNTAGV